MKIDETQQRPRCGAITISDDECQAPEGERHDQAEQDGGR